MKSFVLAFITIFSMVFKVQASSKLKVPRLKTVGAMRTQVIAQTAPEFVEKVGRTSYLRRFYISRWGIHRYEYGYVNISCAGTKCEVVDQEVRLNFFESCSGFKRNGQPNCTKPVVDSFNDSNTSDSQGRRDRPWYACEDYGVNCGRNQDDRSYDEFPSRSDGRYEDDTLGTWGL